MARYLYSELAAAVDARRRCASTPNNEWFDKHTETIEKLVKQHLPHGSGFDSGTTIDLDSSHADKLVFHTSFHHMNENGYYDGWTEHTVTVTPSLQHAFNLRISGRNRNDIKEMMHQNFDYALRTDVRYDLLADRFPELKLVSKWEDKDGNPSQCYQAWYVGERRFWNDYQGARDFAGEEMERKQWNR